jgi:dolichol-phosphate mannosyltransferase
MILPTLPLHFNKNTMPPTISVVAPVFNEADGIRIFTDAVVAELESLAETWEIILVDDGSTDRSWEIMQSLHADDSRIKILRFSKNFGNQAAVSAGLKFAQGDAVITMDSDLQHPPELIPEMVQHWRKGVHCVFTIRTYSNETGFFKRFTSSVFTKIMNVFSHTSLQEGLSDYRLLDRKVVDSVNLMGESSRFLRAMISWLGFRQVGIPFTTKPRVAGTTKFSPLKLFRLAADGITSFSVLPLRWIMACGFAVAVMSLLYAVYILVEVLIIGIDAPGWPTLVVAIMFLGGMQLIAVGIVGEYVGRIFMETKRRPLYVVQDKRGFDAEEQTQINVPSANRKKVV